MSPTTRSSAVFIEWSTSTGVPTLTFLYSLLPFVLTSVIINQPAPLALESFVLTNANDGANGSISVIMTGGTEPYTYQWSNEATSENNINLVQGAYTLSVFDDNNCATDTTFSILDVGVDEMTLKPFEVYPTFATDRIYVRFLHGGTSALTITDISGKQVWMTTTIQDDQFVLSLDLLAVGTYLVRSTNERGSFVQRFIKMPVN